MERKDIAGMCLKLKVQTETKDRAPHYHPRLFGLPHISGGRTGIIFDQKRSPLDENSFRRIGRSPFVGIISKIVVLTGILMLFHMGSRYAPGFFQKRERRHYESCKTHYARVGMDDHRHALYTSRNTCTGSRAARANRQVQERRAGSDACADRPVS